MSQIKIQQSALARSISRHMAHFDAQNSAIHGAIPQNRRRSVRDEAFKISHWSVKPRLRNP